MGVISLDLPTIGNPNSTEDPKVRSNFTTLQTVINGNLDSTNIAASARTVQFAHNVMVSGEVRVPVGQLDVIPAFFVAIKSGGSASIVRIRDIIGSGTSATYKLQKNGSDIYTGEAVTTTATTTDVADNVLADGDRLQIIVTAVAATPTNLGVAIVIEYIN